MSYWHDGKLKKEKVAEAAAFNTAEVVRIKSLKKFECKKNRGDHVFKEFIGKRKHIEYPHTSELMNYTWHLFICAKCRKEKNVWEKPVHN